MIILVSIDEFLHIAWTHKMYDNEGILKMVVIRAQYLLDTSMCGPNSFIVQFEEIDHGCFGWLANNINNAQSHSECRLLFTAVNWKTFWCLGGKIVCYSISILLLRIFATEIVIYFQCTKYFFFTYKNCILQCFPLRPF